MEYTSVAVLKVAFAVAFGVTVPRVDAFAVTVPGYSDVRVPRDAAAAGAVAPGARVPDVLLPSGDAPLVNAF